MKCEKSLLFLFNIALSLECSKLDVDFDISALAGSWEAVDALNLFIFNLCGNSSHCKDGLVCIKEAGEEHTKVLIPDDGSKYEFYKDKNFVSFVIKDENASEGLDEIKLTVEFICGHRPLGATFPPELISKSVDDKMKSFAFEWRTSAACNGDEKLENKISKCYTVDTEKNEIIDLTRLANTVYSIVSPSQNKIYYSLCSVLPETIIPAECAGKAACFVEKNGEVRSTFTELPQPKFISKTGSVEVKFIGSNENGENACSNTFHVTLEFPHVGREHAPAYFTSSSFGDSECEIGILHRTSAARPISDMSSKTCSFSEADVGKSIDIRKDFRVTSFNVDEYELSLCEENKKADHSLGKFYNSIFTSEMITLIYRDGDACEGAESRNYDSVININCVNVSENESEPRLIHKSDNGCEFTFEWNRSEVCQEKLETLCGMVPIGYDLSAIMRQPRSLYEKLSKIVEDKNKEEIFTLDGEKCMFPFTYTTTKGETHKSNGCETYGHNGRAWCCTADKCDMNGKENFGFCELHSHKIYNEDDWKVENVDSDMFLSLCGDLMRNADAEKCPENSLFCDTSNKKITITNIGAIEEIRSGHLQYTMHGPNATVYVQLSCTPGGHYSYPEFISKDESKYHLIWRTAAACKLVQLEGDDCKIESGEKLYIDLSPIAGQHILRPSEDSDDELILSVCEQGLEVGCGNLKGGSGVGACLSVDSAETPVAQNNKKITFKDGIVKLEMSSQTDSNKTALEILFICDDAGDSNEIEFEPVILDKTIWKKGNAKMISVEWRTSAACPPIPVSCSFFDGRLIDLSPLTKWDGTAYEAMDLSGFEKGDENYKEKTVYANLCGEVPLDVDENCPHGSIACYPDERLSLGKATTQILSREDNAIVAQYVKGSNCDSDSSKTWSSKFLIYCNSFSPDHTPRLRKLDKDSCEAEFEWSTPHACTVKRHSSNTCKIKDNETGQVFDFGILAQKGEITRRHKDLDKDIVIQLCAPSQTCCSSQKDCDVSVCYKNDKKAIEYKSKTTLELSRNGVSMHMKGSDLDITVDFVCDRTRGHIEFSPDSLEEIGLTKRTWSFEYRTALACPRMAATCTAHDKESGSHFDLSSLSGVALKAQDTVTYDGKEFILSICGPTPDAHEDPLKAFPKCAELPYEQGYFIESFYRKENSNCSSIGNVQGQPHTSFMKHSNTTAITVDFFGGSKCKEDPEQSYSAVVRLSCAAFPHELEYDASSGCEHWFSMLHPAACEIRQASSEYSDCKVTEPTFGVEFDLSKLKTDDGYVVKDVNQGRKDENQGGKEYKFNVCGKLSDCDGGICLRSDSNSKWQKFSGFSEAIYYSNQVAHLTYVSDQVCDEDVNYVASLQFECAHHDNQDPYIISNDHCHLVIGFPTSEMCPQVTEVECDFYSELSKHGFDLNPLSRPDSNYIVTKWDNDGTPLQYVLNLCRNVVHTKDILCPADSASCLIRKDQESSTKLKFVNLGKISDDSKPFEVTSCQENEECADSELKVIYKNGDKCEGSDDKRSTTIVLQCDQGAIMNTPEFMSDDGCQAVFRWKTEFACPIDTTKEIKDCFAKDSATNYEYDLKEMFKIQKEGLSFSDDGYHYQFSIACSDTLSECPEGSGVCMKKTSGSDTGYKSLGKFSKRVVFNHGALTITYADGDKCPGNEAGKYSTLIQFICDKEAIVPSPSIVAKTHGGCHYQILVHTKEVCEPTAECGAQQLGGRLVDFSALVPSHGHDLVMGIDEDPEDSMESIYLNICGAMEPIKQVDCPPGAAVCRWVRGAGTRPMSIGDYDATAEWAWEEDENPTIVYKSKTSCGNGNFYQTKIELTCDPNRKKDYPRLVAVDEDTCTFLITIANSLTCTDDDSASEPLPIPEKYVPQMENCHIEDDKKNLFFDFNKSNSGDFTDGEFNYKYNICSGLELSDLCKNGAFCRRKVDGSGEWESIGQVQSVKVDHELDLADGIALEMVFSDGRPCIDEPEKKYHTTIWFSCNEHDEETEPVVVSSGKCSVVLSWNTKAVCEKVVGIDDDPSNDKLIDPDTVRQCLFTNPDQSVSYDLSILNRVSESWQISTGDLRFLFNPCGLVMQTDLDDSCRGTMACVKRGDKWSIVSGLAIPRAKWEDNGMLKLSYDEGQDSACNRKDQLPHMSIQFECGSTIGQPQLINPFPDGDCSYEIKWKTTAACRVKERSVILDGYTYVNPVTDQRIELSSDKTFRVGGDVREQGFYKYLINLGNELDWSKLGSSHSQSIRENCNGAAVCRIDSSKNGKAVGKWDRSVTARSDGTALELKLAPENGCTVIFNIMCDRDATSDALSFLEETIHCNIRFQWYTNQTCTGENVSLKSEKGTHVGLWFFLITLISGSTFFLWKKGAPIVDSVRSRFRTISYNQLANDDEDGDDLLFEIENVDDQVFPLVPDSMVDGSALESIPESTSESRAGDPLGAIYRDNPHDSDEDLLV